jgi:hypothetical protein
MRVAREAAALAAISLRLSDGSNGQVLSDSGCMRADRIAGALATRVMLMTGRASNVQDDGQAKQSTEQKSESHDNRPCLQETCNCPELLSGRLLWDGAPDHRYVAIG